MQTEFLIALLHFQSKGLMSKKSFIKKAEIITYQDGILNPAFNETGWTGLEREDRRKLL